MTSLPGIYCCALQFKYDPKTNALQIVSPSGVLFGACLTDSGSFSSGKSDPGDLAVMQCSKVIGPSQQWKMQPVTATAGMAPNHNLRSYSGLCLGLSNGWDLVTVHCGDKSEVLF